MSAVAAAAAGAASAAAGAAAATAASSPVYGHIKPGTRVFVITLPYCCKNATVAGTAGVYREIFATVKRRVEGRGFFGGRHEKVVKVDLPLATAIYEYLPANAIVLQTVFDYRNGLVDVYYIIPEQKQAEHT